MEVHAHTHIPTGREKKWSHYFWEFLMLFLAVFCGFFAEYQLEHKIEKVREKQLVSSLINDLKADTIKIRNLNAFRMELRGQVEILINMLTSDFVNERGFEIYEYASQVSRRAFFFSADGTMQQLKNSGGLRMISKADVADSIKAYDVLCRSILTLQALEEEQVTKYRETASRILDAAVLKKLYVDNIDSATLVKINPKLKQDSPFLLNELSNLLLYRRGNSLRIYLELEVLYSKASNLIELIKKEYHLK